MKVPWQELFTTLYSNLDCEELIYSEPTSSWLKRENSKFLEDNIFCNSGEMSCVLDIVHHLKLPIVQLPSYREKFSLASDTIISLTICPNCLIKTYSLEEMKLFFTYLKLTLIKKVVIQVALFFWLSVLISMRVFLAIHMEVLCRGAAV